MIPTPLNLRSQLAGGQQKMTIRRSETACLSGDSMLQTLKTGELVTAEAPGVGNGLRADSIPAWRAAGLRYHAYNFYLQRRFGGRVRKVSIDAGFTCPNVDGTVARGGCTFCDNRSFSPSRRSPRMSGRDVQGQISEGIRRLKWRYDCDKFIAYFQPATNTYAPVEKLRPLYEAALDHLQIVGLAIGTRPDCVPDEVLDLLQEFAGRTYLSVEYGLQTIHDRSLDWMNRGHHYDSFLDAMERSRGRGFEICAHAILGLPGESHDDMLATARSGAAAPRFGQDS